MSDQGNFRGDGDDQSAWTPCLIRRAVAASMLAACAVSVGCSGGERPSGVDGGGLDASPPTACSDAIACPPGLFCCDDDCDGMRECAADRCSVLPCAEPHGLDGGLGADGGPVGMWTSCAEAHSAATEGERCSFPEACGDCCCEGRTQCAEGRIVRDYCDCLCVTPDAG
jgi:hypothetical protein